MLENIDLHIISLHIWKLKISATYVICILNIHLTVASKKVRL